MEKYDGTDTRKVIKSPLSGRIFPLTEVRDEIFSSGVLGDGIAIEPYDGIVYAPAEGKVTTFFPTGHAIGITTRDGVELLIHIGMDTVNLNGRYFNPLVKQGEYLQIGQPVIQFDIEEIVEAGYEIKTAVIITNPHFWKKVVSTTAQGITAGDTLLWVE